MAWVKSSKKTILIADDSAAQRRFLEILLGLDGHTVVTLEDGLAVIHYLQDHTPDLIIVDVNMPYMNGLEVCEACKAVREETPVIILTNLGDRDTEALAKQAKADAFITKPLLGSGFRCLVQQMLFVASPAPC
jgi:DNA-binding response OmpR family regulator